MVFSSTAFLFAFLPFVLILVYPLRRAWQNAALLVLFILFYVWGAGADVRFIFTVALVAWRPGTRFPRATSKTPNSIMSDIAETMRLSYWKSWWSITTMSASSSKPAA
jgi:hypothetical protein